MKKIIVLVLTVFTFLGCGEELEFNTPSFQAKKDGNLWEAVTFRANIDNTGILTIFASDNLETVTLVANNAALGIHDMVQTASSGTLLDIDDIEFSTNNMPDPSVQLYPADGQIDIKEVNTEEGYVSGEFYFNGFNNSGLSSINVNEGFFYRVPLVNALVDSGTVDVPCTTATVTVAATLVNYNAVMPGDTNYETACNAYMTALETQQTSCGDTDGSIQAIIDGLDCTATGLTSSITVNIDGVARTFDDNVSVNLVGTTKTVRAEDSTNTDYIEFDIEVNQTGTEEFGLDNFLINLNSTDYGVVPMNPTFGELTIDINQNTNNLIQATLTGAINTVVFSGNIDMGLTMGVIDINY